MYGTRSTAVYFTHNDEPFLETGGAYFTVLSVVSGDNSNGKNNENGKNGEENVDENNNNNGDNNDDNNDNEYSIEVNIGYTVTYTEMEERGLVSSLLENRQFSTVGIAHEPLGGDRGDYIGGNSYTNDLVIFAHEYDKMIASTDGYY